MCLTRLTGKNVQVALNDDLSITVSHRDGRPLWESSRSVGRFGRSIRPARTA